MFVPHRRPSTSCYGDSFTLFYVDYVRTSQETPPLPVKGQLYFIVSRLFSYLTGDTSTAWTVFISLSLHTFATISFTRTGSLTNSFNMPTALLEPQIDVTDQQLHQALFSSSAL
jgi:hypothetical protein